MSKTDGFLPHKDDWGKLGEFIGRNTNLKEIRFASLTGSMFSSETRTFEDGAEYGGSGPNFPAISVFKRFCRGLSNNTSVKKVNFIDTPACLEEMALARQGNSDGYGLAYTLLLDWFENNVIEEIKMPFCHCEDGNYDNSGELKKFAAVLDKFNSLKSFRVEFDDGFFGDKEPGYASGAIIDALCNHSNLQYFEIQHSNGKDWNTGGYAALGRLLSTSKSLKKLKLDGEEATTDELVLVVATALSATSDLIGAKSGNSTLEEIDICEYGNDITSEGWNAFAKLICNSGTIMDTYNSNHTLKKVFSMYESRYSPKSEAVLMEKEKEVLGDELYTLLKINTICNSTEAARVKIVMNHLGGDFSMEPFTNMDLAVLPTALAWMGKMNKDIAFAYPNAEADLGLIYKFLRGVAPVIFDPLSESRKKEKDSLAKKQKVKKSRGKNKSNSTYDTANEEEKVRSLHSKSITLVHEEAENTFKSIRQRLNNLHLERSERKVRSTRKKAPMQSMANLLPSEGLEDKAVTSQFVVHVGEVSNLYKSTKPSKKNQGRQQGGSISIDLHGMSRDVALQTLDEQLPKWIDIAMHGEYPFVAKVVIVVGKGSQILSEAVEGWIKENERVANVPKHML